MGLVVGFFSFQRTGGDRDLHSFPTRRSSDLLDALRDDLGEVRRQVGHEIVQVDRVDRKSTRLNSSHVAISYAVFCSKKKIIIKITSVDDAKNMKSRQQRCSANGQISSAGPRY